MVEVGAFDLPPGKVKITSRARGVHRAVYERLRDIVDEGKVDRESWGKLRAIATFRLDQGEKGKASELKSNLTKRFGTDATFAGFRFVVCRNMDATEEYLAVIYQPDRIVPGRFEARQRDQRAKYEARYARQKARAVSGKVGEEGGDGER